MPVKYGKSEAKVVCYLASFVSICWYRATLVEIRIVLNVEIMQQIMNSEKCG